MENKNQKIEKKDLNNLLDSFIDENKNNPDLDCSSGVCIIKGDKSIVERINKKFITEDGRQLLQD